MLSASLELVARRAIDEAVGRSHGDLTVEHLLLALADEPDAAETLVACRVDLDRLRDDLRYVLDVERRDAVAEGDAKARPTIEFSRTLSRAAIHVQSVGQPEIKGSNVLVALFSEKETDAVRLLARQGMTRLDAVNFMAHGIRKEPGTLSGDG